MFTGRIGRLKFLLFHLAVWVVGALAYLFALGIGYNAETDGGAAAAVLVFLIGGLVAFLISLSAGVRRLHDLDQTGWLVLLSLIPLPEKGKGNQTILTARNEHHGPFQAFGGMKRHERHPVS